MIEEPAAISLQSKFFYVTVGATEREQRQLDWLKDWCQSNNVFLQIQSEATDAFRLKIADSLGVVIYEMPRLNVRVSTLVAHIKANNATPNMPPESLSIAKFRERVTHSPRHSCNTSCRVRLTS